MRIEKRSALCLFGRNLNLSLINTFITNHDDSHFNLVLRFGAVELYKKFEFSDHPEMSK